MQCSISLQPGGVPANAIIKGSGSRNTHKNALECKELMQEKGMHKVLLVTSAWHMRRALATFLSVGIAAIPAPTDYEGVGRSQASIMDSLPDAASLECMTNLLSTHSD
ncbi:YdcF family protein [Candidatus Parcubacteria bacterium]|nr:MAG: YdcF family protein [Candidatus Parcubacteria bacterium]